MLSYLDADLGKRLVLLLAVGDGRAHGLILTLELRKLENAQKVQF